MASTTNPLTFPASLRPYDGDLFRNPSSEYRGAPLWSWNTRLKEDTLIRQIDQLAEMGMGGFHIHSRVGLDTPYMGPEFMKLVKACVEHARQKNMMACLYDEDRWPSGAAGGLVLKEHPEFRAQHLLLTPWSYGNAKSKNVSGANGKANRSERGFLVSRYEMTLEDGRISTFRRLSEDEESSERTWYAYVEPNLPSEWFNGETYIDTLNKDAIRRFIETTHDVYYKTLSADFGSVVPSIFTDEPQFAHKSHLRQSSDLQDLFLPWSLDLQDTFKAQYGFDILDRLPELVWDTNNHNSAAMVTRYNYHDHVCERFVSSFMDVMADWTRARRISLIGHMMKEPTLLSQTEALGEAMRCYRNLDMPGIDMLCDLHEYNTAKQATSVARQNGAKGIMSEIYGVTNWTFDFAGHKAAGDWQAALGVVFRVHHLSWVSMAGEAKRDYPAAIGYQSPWYKEYSYIEDYFSRVGVAMTRGNAVTRVAIIHPIESFWITSGPLETSGEEQTFLDQAFKDLTDWLLHGLIDFDFISESLFPTQTSLDSIVAGKPLKVGMCEYDVVILPNLKTIRSSTVERLQAFARGGGAVIVAGSSFSLVDASTPVELPRIPSSLSVQWSSYHILSSLKPWVNLQLMTADEGKHPPVFLYQLRQDDQDQYLFLCNTDPMRYYPCSIRVKGEWSVIVLEALSGKEWELASTLEAGWTTINWHFEVCESLLARLTPCTSSVAPLTKFGQASLKPQQQNIFRDSYKTVGDVRLKAVELSEPNVLLLDYAEFKLNDGHWEDQMEVLRIENIIRRRLNLPQKLEAFKQPWAVSEESRKPYGTLTLRFQIISKTAVLSPKLALEDGAIVGIALNGNSIPSNVSGWWVDEDIATVDLPDLAKGTSLLELTYNFGLLTNIERVYLLGDFEVEIKGTECTLHSQDLSRTTFGDWTRQGYPFYAGNIIYHCSFVPLTSSEPTILEIPRFAGPVVTIDLDGQRKGTIALQPHMLSLGTLDMREHTVSVTCYGNRENSFGTLHLPDGCTKWIAPNAWRTEVDWWQEEYNVKAMGILQRPRLKLPGKEVLLIPKNPEKLWVL